MGMQLRGSIVAIVTPMLSDGRVDTTGYERLLEYHLERGTDGFVVGGTTGESPTLQPTELEDLIRGAVSIVDGRVPVFAGSGTNNTATTIALTRRVCAAGAQGCLVVTPYYNKPTQEGLFQHFQAVADAATVPLILYNVPGRTCCDLLPETVERLSRHRRIGAIKEATAEITRTKEIIRRCGDTIDVVSGDDATALALMHAGASGVISVTANVAPAAMAQLCTAARDGNWEQAQAIDEGLRDLHLALFLEPNPIPVKFALWRMGLIGPDLRLPMTSLAVEYHGRVTDAMKRAGLEVAE